MPAFYFTLRLINLRGNYESARQLAGGAAAEHARAA